METFSFFKQTTHSPKERPQKIYVELLTLDMLGAGIRDHIGVSLACIFYSVCALLFK